jgi:hypothetical protein
VIRILVSTLLSPLALGLLLMAAALALSFTERFGRRARWALVALVAVGWLLGTGPVADALIHPLERPYAVADLEALSPVHGPNIGGHANRGGGSHGRTFRSFFPLAESSRKVERAAHEAVGLVWARVGGGRL